MKKTVKVVTLEGTFPQLPSAKMYQKGKGEGSNLRAAASAAMRDLLKQPALRSRHLTMAKITMSVGSREVEENLSAPVTKPPVKRVSE